jgi:hypothetical protein
MTRGRILALLLALSPLTVLAQNAYVVFEQITVAGTSIGLTASKINPAGRDQAQTAICRLETAQVRYTVDQTTPTSTVGTLLEIGDVLTLAGNDTLNFFRAIRTGGSSGQLDCTYTNP